jgi:DtxR family transcriptional regulator, Mn-dependent transcriptional regulator
MTAVKLPSESASNYLKAIYHLSEPDGGASQHQIAEAVGVSAAGVTKMLQALARDNWISYTPYRRVCLSESGRAAAIEIIRRHRLIELYLVKTLGYEWDKVHLEAERLEHYISEEFEERIERLLGYPTTDPHGDPIPGRDGKMPPVVMTTLNSMPDGASVVVSRVVDEDDAFLRYLDEHGLRPGVRLQIVEREPYGGSLKVHVQGQEVSIGPKAADRVFVETETSASD